MYATFRQDLSNLDLFAKEFKHVAVLQDEDTEDYYCLLPAQTCQFPDSAEGVRRVRKMKSNSLDFVPIQMDSVDTFAGMIDVEDPTVGYSVANDRIKWERDPGVSEVRMDLVIPFELYEYEDYIYVPSGQDENLELSVAKFIEGTPLPDNTV